MGRSRMALRRRIGLFFGRYLGLATGFKFYCAPGRGCGRSIPAWISLPAGDCGIIQMCIFPEESPNESSWLPQSPT
jgi:hypothetical protein